MGTSSPRDRGPSEPTGRPSLQPTVAIVGILLVLGAIALVLVLRPSDESGSVATAPPAASVTNGAEVASETPTALAGSARPSPAYKNGAIAFDHGPDVWVMEADGDDARPLITGAYGIGWSPDGSHLLVVMQDPTTGGEAVAAVGALGDDRRVLGPGSHGAWSPDGGMVAISDPFGAQVTTLVRLADGHQAGTIEGSLPAWSPDGSRVAFLREASPVPPCETEFCPPVPCGMWLFDVASGEEERVTPDEFGCEYGGPQWSPEGSAIAIGHRVIGLDGIELLAWQESRSLAAVPWSPDGSMVAALVADELMNRRTIEVIAVATGERRTVVPEGEALILQVGWSPDCEALVYSAVVADASGNGRPRIHTVRTDGGQPVAIGPDDAQFPLWQPLPSD